MKRRERLMMLVAACTASAAVAGAALADQPRSDEVEPSQSAAPKLKVTAVQAVAEYPISRDVSQMQPGEGGIAGGLSNCCFAHPDPGCDDPGCEALVCAQPGLETCCTGQWDATCAAFAEFLCGDLCVVELGCGDEGTGTCCAANFTPYCDDEECCDAVCADDPFCCGANQGFWDASCADTANKICEVCDIPVHPACVGGEGNCCVANGSPGCEDQDCCSAVCFCDPFCCDTTWDNFCATTGFDPECLCGAGNCGALNTEQCDGLCVVEGCGDALAVSCCAADVVALQQPFCNDETCCNQVCAVDPFCCSGAWDFLCALEAASLCGCEGFFSNITTFLGAGFTHGSDVAADLLELIEPGVVREITFSIANFAAPLTAVDLDLIFMPVEVDGAGDVIEPDPNGPNAVIINIDAEVAQGAGTAALYTIVDDAGFFDTNDLGSVSPQALWAGIRFNSVTGNTLDNVGQGMWNPPTVGFSADVFWLEGFGFAFFGGPPENPAANFGWELLGDPAEPLECGDPDAGDCFVANMTPACDDADCCETVCAQDPFCCDVAWDELCAGAAVDLCDPTPPTCPGDLTNSGTVGVADLLALLGCWGPVAPGCEIADLSDSGTVGVADLLILLGNWGPCP